MTQPFEHTLMIVDDAEEDRVILANLLSNSFNLIVCSDASSAIKSLGLEEKPDLILLDVEMPAINGYDACAMIREDQQLNDIDIIFLSAHDTTEEIIQGLDAGAIDYIAKPYNDNILQTKIKKALAAQKNKQQLEQQAIAATQLAHTLMSESGSMGNVINFLRASFSVGSVKELIQLLIETLNTSGLNTVVLAKTEFQHVLASSQGEPNNLEGELLERFYGQSQPFFEKEQRLFVIQKNIVLFIKNMPVESEKRGSLKDSLMILLEGVNAKLDFFESSHIKSSRRAETVRTAMMDALTKLDEIQTKEVEHKQESKIILEKMVRNVEESVISMGLTEVQETQLISMLQASIQESEFHLDAGVHLDEQVKKTVIELTHAANETT